MNTWELEGALLNHWVARAEGIAFEEDDNPKTDEPEIWRIENGERAMVFDPVRSWADAGPVMLGKWNELSEILQSHFGANWRSMTDGPTTCILIWFMRARVAMVFGDEIDENYSHETA